MFSFSSFPQVISTTNEEFSTKKKQNSSFRDGLVGFNRYFNSNLHLDTLRKENKFISNEPARSIDIR